MEKRWFHLMMLFVLVSVASAIPIEPESGISASSRSDPGPTPLQQIPLPSLPLSATVAAGVLFFIMNLKTDLKTYFINPKDKSLQLKSAEGEWVQQSFSNNNEYLQYLRNIVEASEAEEVPVQNPEGEWVLCPASNVSRYLSMLDSAKKRLAALEKEKTFCRNRLFSARRQARRNGHTRTRQTVFAAKAYDRVLYQIEEVKKTVGTLESWAGSLSGLDFGVDEGFKFNERTFFFSNGVLRGITPEEAYRRFRRKAEAAYDEFTASMKNIRSHLKDNIEAGGWGLVDSTKELLESTYTGFRNELNELRNEYLKEQNGRGGSWNDYHEKLYENYFRDFREKSEGLFEECSLRVDEVAFDVLVPESVKLELEKKAREALEKEKLKWRDRKRRWSQQLRDKANRLQKNLLNEYRRVYDGNLFSEFKEEIDAWCEKARDEARKMKWQRTLEKAEARCQQIDLFLTEGFNSFNALTHQQIAAEVTREYYKPEIEITEAVEEYRKAVEEQPANTTPEQTASAGTIPTGGPQSIIFFGPTTTTSTTTGVGNDFLGGIWSWLTEERDRTGAWGSDVFRWIGSNSVGRGALSFLLGINVYENGRVTTTYADAILNATLVAGPVLRGVSWGARAVGWVGRGFRSCAGGLRALNLSGKLSRVISFTDDFLRVSRSGLTSLKSAISESRLLNSLGIAGKLDDVVRFGDDAVNFIGSQGSWLTSKLGRLQGVVRKGEEVLGTLERSYGLDQIIGTLRKNNTVVGYLSNLGKSRGIEALYGGINARYTRTGLSGLLKAGIGRSFDALVDAGRIVNGKIPKPVRNAVSDMLSDIGWTNKYSGQVADVLKGLDDAATVRSVIYGNEALSAAKSATAEIENTYNSTKAEVEEIIQEAEEDVVSFAEESYNNTVDKIQECLGGLF